MKYAERRCLWAKRRSLWDLQGPALARHGCCDAPGGAAVLIPASPAPCLQTRSWPSCGARWRRSTRWPSKLKGTLQAGLPLGWPPAPEAALPPGPRDACRTAAPAAPSSPIRLLSTHAHALLPHFCPRSPFQLILFVSVPSPSLGLAIIRPRRHFVSSSVPIWCTGAWLPLWLCRISAVFHRAVYLPPNYPYHHTTLQARMNLPSVARRRM